MNVVLQYGTFLHILSCWNLPFIGCLLLFFLFMEIFIVDLGYFHHISTSPRCGNFFVSSCGVEHMALALCLMVLSILYLDARLW